MLLPYPTPYVNPGLSPGINHPFSYLSMYLVHLSTRLYHRIHCCPISVYGGCSFGGLGCRSCRVCVCRGCCSLSVCVCDLLIFLPQSPGLFPVSAERVSSRPAVRRQWSAKPLLILSVYVSSTSIYASPPPNSPPCPGLSRVRVNPNPPICLCISYIYLPRIHCCRVNPNIPPEFTALPWSVSARRGY